MENDEEYGLSRSRKYDGEAFNVWDYMSAEYADAATLGEAIDIRGYKAFLREVNPGEFASNSFAGVTKVGIAELWFDSSWTDGETERKVDKEKLASSVKEGDLLSVRSCSREESEWGYVFDSASGVSLPYTPYHDYDDRLFVRVLDDLRAGEKILCKIRSSTCFGGDGIKTPSWSDPYFHWRVYSCKVTVLRVGRTGQQD